MNVIVMLLALLYPAWAESRQTLAQEQDNTARNYEFFSGVVVDLAPDKLTVERTVLGKSDQKKFNITAETKVEGNLKKGSRVTVGFNAKGDAEAAVRIIVREEEK